MIRYAILALLTATLPAATARAVSFDYSIVGNAGNAPDPITGFGSVAYDYAIANTEVTNGQYAEFLNAVDPTGANALILYNFDMAGRQGGILNTGTSDGARYLAKPGREKSPVNFVSLYDAFRFSNWMHNGQGNGDTESGAYTLLGGGPLPTNGSTVARNPDALFWVPSEDEWYKSAYHDATAGTDGVYFNYANRSSRAPISDLPSDNPAAVNYFRDDRIANGFNDGYAVTGSTAPLSSENPFTDVGAYTAAASPYGTFDQNGNVAEWNETLFTTRFGGTARPRRGGSFGSNGLGLQGRTRGSSHATDEANDVGFRIARIAVPEPSTVAILLPTLLALSQRNPR